MNKRCCSHMLLILIASLIFFTVPAHAADPPMDTLVTVEWLSQHLDDPDLVVLDCTVNVVMDESGGMKSVSGRADYESGHIPGAAFADLMVDLSDADSPHEERPADAGTVLRRHGRAGGRRRHPRGACTTGPSRSGPPGSGGCCAGSVSTKPRFSMADCGPGPLRNNLLPPSFPIIQPES